jgi:hypothetical protein
VYVFPAPFLCDKLSFLLASMGVNGPDAFLVSLLGGLF